MNVTPRSTAACRVASDSVSSTSPYTGVNAMAPKPIALTVNSSPNFTVGTVFALVMVAPNECPRSCIPPGRGSAGQGHRVRGEVAGRDANRGRRDQQPRRVGDGVLLGGALRPVPCFIRPQAGRDVVTERIGQ